MRPGTTWMMLGLGFLLPASACDSGSVGASTDAAVDRAATTVRLDAPLASDAPTQGPTTDAAQATCHGENGACGTSDDVCCDGYTCGTTHLIQTPHCMKLCTQHTECTTGCCTGLGDSGITACLPQVFCPDLFCGALDQGCGTDTPCCDGLACAILGTASASTGVCKQVCTQHTECSTGCCAPLGSSGVSVCLPQSYCPSVYCLTEDRSCRDAGPCCEGLVCVLFETEPPTSTCRPICKQHADCPTGCCVPLGPDHPSACLDKTYCGH